MARQLAPASPWRASLEQTPRHLFVPAWWKGAGAGWVQRAGGDDTTAWLDAAYSDTSLITRVGPLHADHATPGQTTTGRPTSSSTHPSLLISMYRHAEIHPGMDVLDVGTGSGYGTALLCHRVGVQRVTSIDVDPYLVAAAAERLDAVGHHPRIEAVDATTEVPGSFDRIVATVAMPTVPPSWIKALRPGGRISTVLDNTQAILTVDLRDDGTLAGRIERDWAGFMSARHSDDYEPGHKGTVDRLLAERGERTEQGRYPLVNPDDAWELWSTLAVQHPGVRSHWHTDGGEAVCLLWDEAGSWARAEGERGHTPTVHAAGPANLWRELEGLKTRWLIEGRLPLYGANAIVEPDGTIRVWRGAWTVTITG